MKKQTKTRDQWLELIEELLKCRTTTNKRVGDVDTAETFTDLVEEILDRYDNQWR